jgi:hypothetical protein
MEEISLHFSGVSCEPGLVLHTSHNFFLILAIALPRGHYFPFDLHFTDEETKTHLGN